MQTQEDKDANLAENFRQIIYICDRILEAETYNRTSIILMRDVAERGIEILEVSL